MNQLYKAHFRFGTIFLMIGVIGCTRVSNVRSLKAPPKEDLNLKSLEGFQADVVAVISDGDVYAQSLLGNPLTPYGDMRFADQITMLNREDTKGVKVSVAVSNSVAGPPEVFSITPDGHFAVVVETTGQRSVSSKKISELPRGSRITIVNLRELDRPRIVSEVNVGFRPQSVDINHDGRWIAIGGDQEGKGFLQVFRFHDGEMKESFIFSVDETTEMLSKDSRPSEVSLVQWHPRELILCTHLFRQDRVVFFKFRPDLKSRTLQPWGKAVDVGPDPFVGRFFPSGRYYLTANWGRNFEAEIVFDRLPKSFSELALIRLGDRSRPHEVVQKVKTAPSPEGIAVSTDGTTVATVNMQNTLYSIAKPEVYNDLAKISFYRLNEKQGGSLEVVGSTSFHGFLPEGGTFDRSGKYFFSTVFQDTAMNSEYGILKVFRVPSFVDSDVEHIGDIRVPHGVHHVIIR